MKNNNVLGTLIILLSIVVLGYTAFIIYDKVIMKDVKQIEVVEKELPDVVGEYTTMLMDLKNDDNPEESRSASVKLVLYNNGIFTYEYSMNAPVGILGSYVVKEKSIVLTVWFNTGSSTQLDAANGEKILAINKDGSIMDSNINSTYLKENGITVIELVKNNSANISSYDISNRLATAFNEEKKEVSKPNL